ncbi:protein sok [Salmonella enterica]|nr:protein sok [Salmonella enterica]ECY3797477.1 protein sok [Salmonella enterica subsp. enterica serovar Minnesota]EDV6094409.1 protein sok [Salmonella enterica subsp. enterica]MJL37402.1 protein sok [Salmonella enterica subsp. enterica serovar Minnesota]
MLSDIWDASWVNEKLTTGLLLSATQHGNKPPSRHEAESLKRRAHHSPYARTLTTFTFPENNPLIQAVYGQSV